MGDDDLYLLLDRGSARSAIIHVAVMGEEEFSVWFQAGPCFQISEYRESEYEDAAADIAAIYLNVDAETLASSTPVRSILASGHESFWDPGEYASGLQLMDDAASSSPRE